MDHNDGRIAGADDGSPDEQPDYLHLAWLLQEKLNDLIDSRKPPGWELQSMLNLAASRNVISYDPRVMNPGVWRNLPPELLVLVFARLPLRDISRLRCLSRKWHTDMATPNSEFNQACAAAHPNLVAHISSWGHRGNEIHVRMFDFSKNIWHRSFFLRLGEANGYKMSLMRADDGGLVCVAFRADANPMAIVVFNPLTRVRLELPPLLHEYTLPPTLVQIKVNLETKCYRVFVIRKTEGRPTVEVYDSGMKMWTEEVPPVGFIYAHTGVWRRRDDGWCIFLRRVRCTFDSVVVTLEIHELLERFERLSAVDSAIYMDREFVLRKVEQNLDRNVDSKDMVPEAFCISEYQAENNSEDWVQVGTHRCPAFGNYSQGEYDKMDLLASDGILMVVIFSAGMEHCWHLNLATDVWCELPEYASSSSWSMLCRAFWNIIP